MNQQEQSRVKILLLIEDDVVLRDMYAKEFASESLDVEIAGNGQEGIQKMKILKPDVVVLDLVMPKMSGFDVLKIVESDPELANTPIIILTNIMVDVTEMMDKGQVVKCLIKSDTTPAIVLKEIKDILQKQQTKNV